MRVGPVLGNLAVARRYEHAGAAELGEVQRRLLRRLVRHAAADVPYYRARVPAAVAGAVRGPADLVHLPVLDRTDLNRRPADLLADGFTVDNTKAATTSGSSGVPATVRNSERDLAYLRAVYLHDLLTSGLRPWDRLAYFRVKPFLRHPLERFGLLATTHVDTSAPLDVQVDTFLGARPTFVVGFPTVILAVVEELERRGERYRGVRHVVFGGERLTPSTRARVLDHFGADGAEVYASVEAFTIARSCPLGRLHLRTADVVVEVEHEDGTVSVEEGEGEVLVTRLRSEAMPLLRYRLGDRVAVDPGRCACGVYATPVVRAVQGRTEDRVVGRDGRAVHGDFLTFAVQDFPEVRRVQVVQERAGHVRVDVVTAPGRRAGLLDDVRSSLEAAVPGWDVAVREVDAIRPEANGKVKVVKQEQAPVDGGPGA